MNNAENSNLNIQSLTSGTKDEDFKQLATANDLDGLKVMLVENYEPNSERKFFYALDTVCKNLLFSKNKNEATYAQQRLELSDIFLTLLSLPWFNKISATEENNYSVENLIKDALKCDNPALTISMYKNAALLKVICNPDFLESIFKFIVTESLWQQLMLLVDHFNIEDEQYLEPTKNDLIINSIKTGNIDTLQYLLHAGLSCQADEYFPCILMYLQKLSTKDTKAKIIAAAMFQELMSTAWFIDCAIRNNAIFLNTYFLALKLDADHAIDKLQPHAAKVITERLDLFGRYDVLFEKLHSMQKLGNLNDILDSETVSNALQSLVKRLEMPLLEDIFAQVLTLDVIKNSLSDEHNYLDIMGAIVKKHAYPLLTILKTSITISQETLADLEETSLRRTVRDLDADAFVNLLKAGFCSSADSTTIKYIIKAICDKFEFLISNEDKSKIKIMFGAIVAHPELVRKLGNDSHSFVSVVLYLASLDLSDELNALLNMQDFDYPMLWSSINDHMHAGASMGRLIKTLSATHDLKKLKPLFNSEDFAIYFPSFIDYMLTNNLQPLIDRLLNELTIEMLNLHSRDEFEFEPENHFMTPWLQNYITNIHNNGLQLDSDEQKHILLMLLNADLDSKLPLINQISILCFILNATIEPNAQQIAEIENLRNNSFNKILAPDIVENKLREILELAGFPKLQELINFCINQQQQGLYNSALSKLNEFLHSIQNDPILMVMLLGDIAKAHLEQGDIEAAEYFYTSLSKAPYNSSEAKYCLAEIYESSNKPELLLAAKWLYMGIAGDGHGSAISKINNIIQQKLGDKFDKIEELLICYISAGFHLQPVTTQDGQSYEKSFLLKWFETSKTTNDPNTRNPIAVENLVNNNFLLSLTEFLILSSNDLLEFPMLYSDGTPENKNFWKNPVLNRAGEIVELLDGQQLTDKGLGLREDFKSRSFIEYVKQNLAPKPEAVQQQEQQLQTPKVKPKF
jgi:hypothetical protein